MALISRFTAGMLLAMFVSFIGAVTAALFAVYWAAAILGFVFLLALLGEGVYLVLKYFDESIGWVRGTSNKMSAHEAKMVIKHYLLYHEGVRVESSVAGTSIENPQGEGDKVRVYQLTGERVNKAEYVGVVLDLEKEIRVDPESFKSRESAVRKVDNIQKVTAETREELESKMDDAKKEVGQSLREPYVEKRFDSDTGEKILERERPMASTGPKSGSENGE